MLNGTSFSDSDQSKSFLHHLDASIYNKSKETILTTFNILERSKNSFKTDPPVEYYINNLPGTILALYNAESRTSSNTIRNPYSTRNTPVANTTDDTRNGTTSNDNDIIARWESLNPYEEDPYINFIKNSSRNNNNSSRRPYTGKFKGKCSAYGVTGHHAKNCFFLRKLQLCLSFLDKNPNYISEVRSNHRQRNVYNKNRATIRKLIDDTFIPYDNVDIDIFLDEARDDLFLEQQE